MALSLAIDQAREVRRILVRLRRHDQRLLQAFGGVGVPHQLGNPYRLAGLVLAGKDAQVPRCFRDRPLEHTKLRCRQAAIRHRHRALEIDRPDRLKAARANLLGARGGVDRREGDALDTFAALGEESTGRRVVVGLGEDAEQLDVIGIEHDGVVARAHLGAVGAARRQREAEPLPGLGRRIELLHHDDGVIDTDDVLQGHAFVSLH
jgi:hypothetical protein